MRQKRPSPAELICTKRRFASCAIGGELLRVAAIAAAVTALGSTAEADEGGLGFWIPGFFGSLSAAPQVPGFTLTNLYYHSDVSAGGNVSFAREVPLGNFTANLTAKLNATLEAKADLGLVAPGYVFATPVFGAQAVIVVAIPYGREAATINANVVGSLGPIPFALSRTLNSSLESYGDMIPQASLRWNSGVNNWMTYLTGDVPVGDYNPKRLTNLGLGFGAIDGGGGYTYLDSKTGREFSAVLGFTYSLENDATRYQNGVDMHLDLGASQFLTKQLQVGLVAYDYQQISCDSGAGDRVGCFESRVLGAGPQIGYIIPFGDAQGYLNLKAYKEFAAQNRAEGWNAWLTFALSNAPPKRP
jgi:hypothetical protein